MATAIEGQGTTIAHQLGPILQLNVEGFTAAKKQVVEQLARNNKVIAILLQETHCNNPDFLAIAGYELCAFTTSKHHGIATFVSQDATWSTVARSHSNSEIEWLAIRIEDMTIVNIYKPPPTRLTPTSLPSFGNQCIYAGDFNCQHSEWGYHMCSADGDALTAWASANDLTLLYDPKEPASFHSQRWNSDTNPDLAFVHTADTGIPTRRVLEKFPRSQHRPSLISSPCLAAPIACKPVKRWNFRKANWETFKQMTDVATSQLPPPDTADTEDAYKAFCRILTNSAKHSIPRGYNKNYIPCWDDECEQQYKEHIDSENTESASTATSLLNVLDEKRRQRWNETVSSIDFMHSSRKAWQTLNRLTGRSTLQTGKCPVTANSIAAQLVQNGRFPNHDREFTRQVSKEYTSLWRAQSVDTDLARDFSYEELTIALKHLRHGKAPGPDNMHAEFLLHAGDHAKEWLRKFCNKCLQTCKLPRIWRMATVIAILKPNKPKDDPKSYRPISLLCIPYKIVERLIYNRISPVIDPQLPQEQAGFRPGRSTLDQVAKLTSDIELAFDGNLKGGAVFVDLTAAYDTVWRRGLILKLLRMLPNRHI